MMFDDGGMSRSMMSCDERTTTYDDETMGNGPKDDRSREETRDRGESYVIADDNIADAVT